MTEVLILPCPEVPLRSAWGKLTFILMRNNHSLRKSSASRNLIRHLELEIKNESAMYWRKWSCIEENDLLKKCYAENGGDKSINWSDNTVFFVSASTFALYVSNKCALTVGLLLVSYTGDSRLYWTNLIKDFPCWIVTYCSRGWIDLEEDLLP